MKQIVLGKTGIEAVRLGFGGIPIQRLNEADAVKVVIHALEKGMNFIDTSRVYTTSEARIGKALKESGRRATIATKSFSRSADGIRKDIEVSLKELQLEYIDIYQCHGISSDDDYQRVTAPGGALSGLLKAKEEGIIGHIGITSHNLELLDKMLDDDLFETIMVCFSFLEPAAKDKVIPKAKAKNVGILAMKPLSGGVISNPEIALKWVFSFPDILVLVGMEYVSFIDQCWQVFQSDYHLTAEELQQIQQITREFDQKFCRRCDYCLPCPAEIPIQFVLGLRSMVRRMGLAMLRGPMFKDMAEKVPNCTECGECMARCPYQLPIIDMIKENMAWARDLLEQSAT